MKKLTNKQGFTLIEVVLVLAIGGLIFLLAFIAFQQVSANRRDTQRRADAGRIAGEFSNYISDGGKLSNLQFGAVPAGSPIDVCATSTDTAATVIKKYLCNNSSEFKSPTGANYQVASLTDSANVEQTNFYPTNKDIIVVVVRTCKDAATGYSVRVGLEKGVVCKDLQS